MFGYYLLEAYSFLLRRDRTGADQEGKGGGMELEGVEGGKLYSGCII